MTTSTAKKGTPTPKRTSTSRTAVPGPKPEFHLIGDLLHYQAPKAKIEIVVDVDPPFTILETILDDDALADEAAQFKMLLTLLNDEENLAKIRQLRTSEFFSLAMRTIEEIQKRMGVSLGESDGSSESSEESTEKP